MRGLMHGLMRLRCGSESGSEAGTESGCYRGVIRVLVVAGEETVVWSSGVDISGRLMIKIQRVV